MASCTVTFLPIFFAGVIFATAFRDSPRPDVDLGSNIGGVVLGGLSEYLSLVVGFNGLLAITVHPDALHDEPRRIVVIRRDHLTRAAQLLLVSDRAEMITLAQQQPSVDQLSRSRLDRQLLRAQQSPPPAPAQLERTRRE